jgi:hypothetical protein
MEDLEGVKDYDILGALICPCCQRVDILQAATQLSPHGGMDAIIANAGVFEDNPIFDTPPAYCGTVEQ